MHPYFLIALLGSAGLFTLFVGYAWFDMRRAEKQFSKSKKAPTDTH